MENIWLLAGFRFGHRHLTFQRLPEAFSREAGGMLLAEDGFLLTGSAIFPIQEHNFRTAGGFLRLHGANFRP